MDSPDPQVRHPLCRRAQLSQEFQTLCRELRGNRRSTGNIAARARHAADETNTNRVPSNCHNGNGRRGVLGGQRGDRTICHNHIEFELRELCSQTRNKFSLAAGGAPFDDQVFLLDPTELAQRFKENCPLASNRSCRQNAEAASLPGLLRTGGDAAPTRLTATISMNVRRSITESPRRRRSSHATPSGRASPRSRQDRTLQMLVADFVAARAAAGMTQREVAMRMWTKKRGVPREPLLRATDPGYDRFICKSCPLFIPRLRGDDAGFSE